METPADVLIYTDQLTGEAKHRGMLLSMSPLGYYEINIQTPGGPRRALFPISRTFVVATEVEESSTLATEIER
ncbi:MAG: hypothetical protein F9K16_13895 [Thermoanaerobaculia bacterium]|jgi:hypothetical protein|nr:MAG: hypothetical protein F9K16_13895 [Thermoanaerobaculia bacterium]MBZ0100542.1 hypothetical protein [Thermoanaerobaculia bacterium]